MKMNFLQHNKYYQYVLMVSLYVAVAIFLCAPLKAQDEVIKTGWFPFEPYMYVKETQGFSQLTGLDIKMIEALSQHLGVKPDFSVVQWKQFLSDIKSGQRLIAPFATKTKERSEWAYFSIPYRFEENALFVKYGSSLEFKNVQSFVDMAKKTGFRLGIMDGFVYASDAINDFINDPQYQHQIMRAKFENDNLNNLLKDKIDGFLTDRLVGATLIWRSGHSKDVEERYLGVSTPIHFLISKKLGSPEFLEKVNKAIQEMKASGEHRKIMREYILPVLLMQTIDRPWFLWIEVLAIIAFVIAGMMIADKENFSVLATFGLAIVPSFGGGLIRDIIVGRTPVGILVTPRYVYIVIIAFLTVLFFINVYDFLRHKMKLFVIDKYVPSKAEITRLIQLLDAMGTSAFTVIGVLVAVLGKADPLWIWGPLFAVMTGVGGSTMRNALAGYRALGNELTYAEIPLLCGLGLSLYLDNQVEHVDPTQILLVVLLTIFIGFLMHVFVYHWNIPSIKIHLFKKIPPS
ncbi:transporter substrate-binding domain-containing protein [Candidatus Nucleicultrix amoebiphila]|jgi:polar amino acid transport system substrate-binding protein|uniref:Solute-binding protein family 3/N-terminal domain-containing protein n=1 Tax=Candidatus Nucleicultrix amoebiphila FS5 TaxID=1414854 RepID=A0A1W6N2X8_9PROT|nr:transporter substrate-binding domain-containing protein [Candidatus Nucleicultrix amoebiphila]ARN84220.1 hypothetical protein GQ61_01425 [Candidatus Nucleicultrix amoebiphila FS5]